jgi:hypothetical protein
MLQADRAQGTGGPPGTVCQCSPVSDARSNPADGSAGHFSATAARDLAALSAVEILGAHIVDLMTAAAVKTGLYEGGEQVQDLADARILIDALAGFVTAAVPHLGSQHAGPLRDGVKSLQLAFAEACVVPDPPGQGPGEKYTGAIRR